MSRPALGDPIDLPWWVVPMGWLPAGAMVGALLVPSPWWARAAAIASSLAVIWLTARIASRVESGAMQSVWISTLYGLWVFFLLVWIAGIIEAR